jgi:hypothetical protein
VKILAVSDQVVDRIYSLISTGHFHDIDLLWLRGTALPYLETLGYDDEPAAVLVPGIMTPSTATTGLNPVSGAECGPAGGPS